MIACILCGSLIGNVSSDVKKKEHPGNISSSFVTEAKKIST